MGVLGAFARDDLDFPVLLGVPSINIFSGSGYGSPSSPGANDVKET